MDIGINRWMIVINIGIGSDRDRGDIYLNI